MKKSFMSTLTLLGVLLLLVLWYVVYEKNIKVQRKEAKENSKLVVSLDRKEIQELEIDRLSNLEELLAATSKPEPRYDTIKFRRLDKSWLITEPLADKADASTVTSVLSTLTTTKHEREVAANPEDLSVYGLDYPRYRIRLRKNSSEPFVEVLIGKDTPVGYSSYLIPAGEKGAVYRVARSLRTSFDKKLSDYRNKNLFSVTRDDIDDLEIKNRYGSFIVARTDADAWTLARENIPASTDEVKKLLTTVLDMRAKEFATEKAENLSKYGLAQPTVQIHIKTKNEKLRERLSLGKVGEMVYAKRSDKDTIYEVDPKALDTLGRPAKEYRNRSLAEFNRFNIKRIRFERGQETLELLKADNTWTIPAQPKAEVDTHKVEALIAKVQDTKVTRYATSQTPNTGFKKPQLTLRLSDNDGDKLNVLLRFGSKQGEQIFVQRENLPVPFLIKLSDYKEINLETSAFLKTPTTEKSETLPKSGENKKES